MDNLCITGASISRCPWFTWADYLTETLSPATVTNYSAKGAGNHYIIRSAIHGLQSKKKPSLVAIMLTNFDKYDMWVSGTQCQILADEKHVPRWLDGIQSTNRGFWCTGCHFPLIKEVYKKHFFDLEISAAQDLTSLLGLIKYCEDLHVPLIVMFDSPVLDYTEEQINVWVQKQIVPVERDFRSSIIVGPLVKSLEPYVVDTQGLIGFCIENDLPWHNVTYGSHPPSLSHWIYFQKKIMPWMKKHNSNLELSDLDPEYEVLIQKMTETWKNSRF